MGVASSSRSFFQQIGGSIGVSIFGVIFFRALSSQLPSAAKSALGSGGVNFNPKTVLQLQPSIRDAVFHAISHGIDVVFTWAAPTSAIVFGLAWLIKEIPLRGRPDTPASTPTAERELVRQG